MIQKSEIAFEIKNRFTSKVIFRHDAVRAAIRSEIDLWRANLLGADLSRADLIKIRDDYWSVLELAKDEAEGLRSAIAEGRIDGNVYEGECACLVGTISKIKGCGYKELPSLKPDANRPAERFFLGIKKGDTPAINQISKIVLQWTDEWLENFKTKEK